MAVEWAAAGWDMDGGGRLGIREKRGGGRMGFVEYRTRGNDY